MSEPRKMALVQLSAQFLRDWLQLPADVIVTGVRENQAYPGTLEFRVDGMGYEVQDGLPLRTIFALVHQDVTEDGRKLLPRIEWQIP